jgi:carbamoyltransferase
VHVLGISGLAHDSAAALIGDSGVLAAIEEGKLTRERSVAGIPRQAIRFCLDFARISAGNLDKIAVAGRPGRAWLRRAHLRVLTLPTAPVSSTYYQSRALGEFSRDLNHLRLLRQFAGGSPDRVVALDHHLCHAASAFYGSPFDRSLILTCDEQGDGISTFVGIGSGSSISESRRIPFPHSLAWVYTQVTHLLGFRPQQDEHKTQWLSLAGRPIYSDVFLKMFRGSHSLAPRLNHEYFNRSLTGHVAFSGAFFRALETPISYPLPEAIRADVAASLHHAFAQILVEYTESLRRETSLDSLCLAGGLFLNPLLVSAIERGAGFRHIFVQPAAGNEGTSLGAAWLTRHQLLGLPRSAPMPLPYWGPSFSGEEVKAVLDNCKATYHWLDSEALRVETALDLLQKGKIVAWCQGRAEFGPRALGNRSLLASPWAPYVRENLNDFVKHRESFRPFALAVTEEDCPRFFDCPSLGRFMTTMARVLPSFTQLPRELVLPGDLVRLHVVSRSDNPSFWRLLHRAGEISPAPLLVNTSFNLFGEPLVVSPRDALRSFYCSGVDALVLGDFLLTKSPIQTPLAGEFEDESSRRWTQV